MVEPDAYLVAPGQCALLLDIRLSGEAGELENKGLVHFECNQSFAGTLMNPDE